MIDVLKAPIIAPPASSSLRAITAHDYYQRVIDQLQQSHEFFMTCYDVRGEPGREILRNALEIASNGGEVVALVGAIGFGSKAEGQQTRRLLAQISEEGAIARSLTPPLNPRRPHEKQVAVGGLAAVGSANFTPHDLSWPQIVVTEDALKSGGLGELVRGDILATAKGMRRKSETVQIPGDPQSIYLVDKAIQERAKEAITASTAFCLFGPYVGKSMLLDTVAQAMANGSQGMIILPLKNNHGVYNRWHMKWARKLVEKGFDPNMILFYNGMFHLKGAITQDANGTLTINVGSDNWNTNPFGAGGNSERNIESKNPVLVADVQRILAETILSDTISFAERQRRGV